MEDQRLRLNENYPSGLVLPRRYGEPHPKKWGAPPEWGLAGQDFEGRQGCFVRGIFLPICV